METLGMTQSVCSRCGAVVPAKVVTDGRDVYFRKFCPEDGEHRTFIRSDVKEYLRVQRYVKPAWMPVTFMGDSRTLCPGGLRVLRASRAAPLYADRRDHHTM